MELVLNLAWLLLALPAYWLWRSSRSARAEHGFTSAQCLLALGCVLVMLFPVISATDDLMAMRTEMEESPISKRTIRQAISEKSSASHSRLQTPPAILGTHLPFALTIERGDLPPSPFLSLPATPSILPSVRAPPAACVA
jgi:hypothetical protein